MKELMCTHLSKRGSTYYFRRKTPVDLIDIFGKEVMKSLGTKDRKAAEILVRKMGVKYDGLFSQAHKEALGGVDNSLPTLPLQSTLTNRPQFDDGLGIKEAPIYAARFLNLLRTRREAAITGNRFNDFQSYLAATEGDAAEYLNKGLHPFEDNPEPVWKLAAQLQAIKALRDNVELPYQELTNTAPTKASSKAEPSTPLLIELVSKWDKERNPKPRSVVKMRRVVNRFDEIVGSKQIAQITKKDAVEFKDELLKEGSSPANVNQYLTELNTILNFASNQAIIDSNPASGIRVRVSESAKSKRLPFDLPALELIFSSPIYTNSARPSGGKGEAAYWLPLIALYTGARLNELCQLTTEDIYIESYLDAEGSEVDVWLFHLTNEGDGQELKNDGSRRRIPIHKELIRLGFIKYVQDLKGSSIFPELKPARAYGSLSANWSKWFGRYLRETIQIKDKRMVFHSFRHCFKDYARQASITSEVHNALTGHSSGDVADNYGSDKYPLRPLAEAMNKYKVTGLDLTFA